MTIAAATETETKELYRQAHKTANILQDYVQGSANGLEGTKGRLSVADVDTLIADLTTAAQAVTAAA